MANSTPVRVVLDTNILLSACWTPDGLEARTVALTLCREVTACVSPAVVTEYHDVLFRAKFSALHARAGEMLAALEGVAEVFEPAVAIHAASDEDDNRFLECASAAGAEYLVTGNLRHYPALWASTRVVNAREFLNSISKL